MSDEITIRPADIDDAALLIELRERMLRELGRTDEDHIRTLAENSLAWFQNAFPDGKAFGWLAEKGGRVVGGVSMTIVETQPQYRSMSGRIASIYGLYVEADERGAGIATRLVRDAVGHAESLGIDIVTLHAADKARPVYERIGFEPSSEMRLFLTDL